jgi:hypothetical protein
LELAGAEIATNFNDFTPTLCGKGAASGTCASSRGPSERHPQKGPWERFMWHDFTKVLRGLRRTLGESGESGGSYRPDLHYMRGPGPKWHAKYGNLVTKTSPIGAPLGTALRDIADIAEHRA